MRARTTFIRSFLVVCLALAANPVRAAAYDIRAELIFATAAGAWAVQIRNVGPTIPGPVRSEYVLTIPAGVKISSSTLNGWQCSPSPPFKGPKTVSCRITLQGNWAAGTILSNQVFYVVPPLAQPGAVAPQACVRAQLLLPDASGTYLPSPESSTSNNGKCA